MIEVKGINILVLSIFAYFLGNYITKKVNILDRWHIPTGVIGGLPLCILFYIISKYTDKNFVFDSELRNFFLLAFFCTTGMLINISELLQGGKILLKLVVVLFLFLVLQNVVGIASAMLLGIQLIDGLIIGSITLAGGHGTAISWGMHLEQLGYTGSMDIGLIGATLGLISGAMIGGSVASNLIQEYNLKTKKDERQGMEEIVDKERELLKIVSSTPLFLQTILLILVVIITGCSLNKLLNSQGIICPDYLPIMFTGILVVIFGNRYTKKFIDKKKTSLLNNVSLQIFISMTIMTIKIESLFNTGILKVLSILLFQIIFIILFARLVFFKIGGKNYDSAVLTAGFIGAGLGATPVGIANMEVVTKTHGMSFRAFLLLPLLGSVFTDLLNAAVVSFFINIIK